MGKPVREDRSERCQVKEVSRQIDSAIGRDRLPNRRVKATGEYDGVRESNARKLPIHEQTNFAKRSSSIRGVRRQITKVVVGSVIVL